MTKISVRVAERRGVFPSLARRFKSLHKCRVLPLLVEVAVEVRLFHVRSCRAQTDYLLGDANTFASVRTIVRRWRDVWHGGQILLEVLAAAGSGLAAQAVHGQ